MKFWESENGLRVVVLIVVLVTVGGSVLASPLIDGLRGETGSSGAEAREEQDVRMGAADYLEELEAQELNAVQEQVRMAEEARHGTASGGDMLSGQEPSQGEAPSWAKRFAHSVVMGDSIAVGFTDFNYLDATSVVAKTGISMTAAVSEVETVKELAPEHVFLYYGFNDIGHDGEEYDRFRRKFVTLLETIQTEVPEADIYVNSLFQPLPENQTMNGYYNDVSPYNAVLQEECAQHGVTFLDNTDLPTATDFANDGYHLQAGFYSRWLEVMANAAGL